MSFVERHLAEGEKILLSGKVCKWIYMPMVVVFVLVGLVGFGGYLKIGIPSSWWQTFERIEFAVGGIIFFLIGVYNYFKYTCVEMVVTDKRVVYKSGIFASTTNELRLEKIEGVSVNRSFTGAMIGYGDILFSGVGAATVVFPNVADPMTIKTAVDGILDKNKA